MDSYQRSLLENFKFSSYIDFLPVDIIYSIVYYIDNSKDLNNFIVNYSYKHNDDFWKNIFYQHIPKAKIFPHYRHYVNNYLKYRYAGLYTVQSEYLLSKPIMYYPYGFYKGSNFRGNLITLYTNGTLKIPKEYINVITNSPNESDLHINNLNIVDFDYTNKYIVFITYNGDLYTMGKNNYGQLGHGDYVDRNTPTRVEGNFGKILKVSVYRQYIAFINDKREVFTCGKGTWGNLGHGDTLNQSIPKKIERNYLGNIIDVKCGRHFILLLNDIGICFCFGRSISDRTGVYRLYKNHPKIFQFSLDLGYSVETRLNIVSISCSGIHILFLDGLGNVHSYGKQEHGELGIGIHGEHMTLEPQLISFNQKIKYISAGYYRSSFITFSNELYAFGRYRNVLTETGDEIIDYSDIPVKINVPMNSLDSIDSKFGGIVVKGYNF